MDETQNIDTTLYGNQVDLAVIKERLQIRDASEITKLDFTEPSENFCWETTETYYVLIGYKEFDGFHFKKMKPYQYNNTSNTKIPVGYGWTSPDGDLIENAYMPCNACWDDRVILGFTSL